MSATIVFAPKATNSFYTVTELNTFFTGLATVINAKADLDSAITLTSNLNVGNVSLLNVADGVDATDAINVRQARTLAGLSS